MEFLQLHRQSSLVDLVARKHAKVRREPQHSAQNNEPLRRVVLVPQERVAVIRRELMVEIVIAFSHSQDRRQKMVAGGKQIVVRGPSEPMCDRIDAECTLNEEKKVRGFV